MPLDYFVRLHSGDADKFNAVPKKKRSLLPLLTVVFLLSYGLMTMLIVEQGSVIQSQRNLIKILMTRQRRTVDHERQGHRRSADGSDESVRAPRRLRRLKLRRPRLRSTQSSVDPGSTAAPFPRPHR